METGMRQIDMKKGSRILLAVIVLFLMVQIIWKIGYQNNVTGKVIENSVEEMTIPSNITQNLQNDITFSQSIYPEYGYINEIRTVLLNTGDELSGTLEIRIIDENEKEILRKEKEIQEIKAGEWNTFPVYRQVKEGKRYELEFTVHDAEQMPAVLLINDAFGLKECRECFEDGQQLPGNLLLSISYKETKSLLFRVLISILTILAGSIVILHLIGKETLGKIQNVIWKENDFRPAFYWILLGSIAIITIFVHCYQLTRIPYGVNVDEIGSGYDAYCIANWGVDRFRMSYPVYFINIGTGQNALYAYLLAILFKLFGYSNVLLRVPAVFNAFLTVFFGAKIVKMKFQTRKSVVLFAMLYSILPIFIMSTRFGLESYLMLGFSTLFLYTLLYAVERKKIIFYIISGICAGILLYTYAISYLVMMLFLLIVLCYMLYTKQIHWKQIIAFAIPMLLLAFPLILCQLINMFDLPEMKIGKITITKLMGYRGSEVSLKHVAANFLYTLQCVFRYDHIHYNSIPQYLTMYGVSIPLIIIGLCHALETSILAVKQRKWDISSVMIIWFGCMLLIGSLLGGNGPNCNKVNGIFIACLFFLVEGLLEIISLRKNLKWMNVVLLIVMAAYAVGFVNWSEYYFHQYPKEVSSEQYFEPLYTDALQILQNAGEEVNNRTTYIEEYSAIFYCGSTLISPYDIDYLTEQKQYQNYIFHYAGEKENGVNYILRDTSVQDAMELEKMGFTVRKTDGWFVCYQ